MSPWTGSTLVLDNGLLPICSQAITWTNTDLLSVGSSGTNFSVWLVIKIQNFSFKWSGLVMYNLVFAHYRPNSSTPSSDATQHRHAYISTWYKPIQRSWTQETLFIPAVNWTVKSSVVRRRQLTCSWGCFHELTVNSSDVHRSIIMFLIYSGDIMMIINRLSKIWHFFCAFWSSLHVYNFPLPQNARDVIDLCVVLGFVNKVHFSCGNSPLDH